MSVLFGKWNIDGERVDPGYLQKAKDMLAPYGPDGQGVYIKDGAGILYRAFHTTKESRQESQPLVTPCGSVLCWDGRLDNREELLRELGEPLTSGATDLEIVAAAYEAKGTACFAKLLGDWALSIWEPKTRSVVLAKDPIGTRHLYYSFDKNQITWSTILDPLVLLAGKTFALEEEYIAGWLSFFPATHLTPYVGIHSVPPSCFVRLEPGRQTIKKYWDFDSSKRIRYRTDGEYEEHFRQVFRESVKHRLRSDSPVLAELSGGMDSSSIVCMADSIIARAGDGTPQLDTVSYYDNSEPNWNEASYFATVEKKRGRSGCHISIDTHRNLAPDFGSNNFAAAPSFRGPADEAGELAKCIKSGKYRVLLSGVGGDEVTGGVPTPAPEILDLFASAQLGELARQLRAWALYKRRPLFRLFFESARNFSPLPLSPKSERSQQPRWIKSGFAERHAAALSGYKSRLKLFGALPSFQENLNALEALRRQLGAFVSVPDLLCEKRYPFLDRMFLEWVYSIPREQLLRPGFRRSLMRRALAEIVPKAILQRRRKAFVSRSPLIALASDFNVEQVGGGLISEGLGIIDSQKFFEMLLEARRGMEVPIVTIIRALRLEFWLRHAQGREILGGGLARHPCALPTAKNNAICTAPHKQLSSAS